MLMDDNIITPSTVILGGNEENTYTIVGLDENQYDNLIDSINSGNSAIIDILKVSNESGASCVLTRGDLDYLIDVQTQQTFFQSLFLGLIVCILFVLGLKK